MTKKKEKNLQSSGLADLQATKTLTRHFVTPSPKGRGERTAFTLAEVLITLGIIGVVAAMTIPTLVANYQEKSWSTSASVFERKLTEALRVMNTQQALAGYTTTEDFVDELKKHIKIIKTCDNTKLDSCFPKTFTYGFPETETMDITTFTDSSKLRKEPFGTNTVGIQFANGVSGVLAYDPSCRQDPYSNTVTGMGCISMIYDTSGFKSPNEPNKDLRFLNVNKLFGFKIDDIKYSAPFIPTPLTKAECEELSDISECSHEQDYWAGAVKACGGTSNMPEFSELTPIAQMIYPDNTNISSAEHEMQYCPKDSNNKYTNCIKHDIAAKFGFNDETFSIWSNEEMDSSDAVARYFSKSYTNWEYRDGRNSSKVYAICKLED